jgi:peptidoglycan LD-endopeptidase CwlK
MTLNARSQQTLNGIHPDLVRVVIRAHALCEADGIDFIVTDGLRSTERQKELVRAGKSKTMKSRHLTGHAVDLCAFHGAGNVSWDSDELRALAQRMKKAATELGVPIEWGGDWKSFVDQPHYQLPWKQYPVDKVSISNVEHSISNVEPEPVTAVPAPAGELKKSGTIWGSIGAAFAGVSMYFEQAFSTLVQAGAALTELGPAQGLLASIGANTKALSLGLLVMCVGVVISRRIKAKVEGKAG